MEEERNNMNEGRANNLPIIKKRGLHNWKNLFRWPNGYEWTILIMLAFVLIIAYSYKHETALCKYTVENFDTLCIQYQTQLNKIEKFNNDQAQSQRVNFSLAEEYLKNSGLKKE